MYNLCATAKTYLFEISKLAHNKLWTKWLRGSSIYHLCHTMLSNHIYIFCCDRDSNPRPCIYYVLSLPTELAMTLLMT